VKTFQFRVPSTIVSGNGTAEGTGVYVKTLGRKALIVTDNLLDKIGILNEIKTSLKWRRSSAR
jgi:alcohol dehydrogenase class IV